MAKELPAITNVNKGLCHRRVQEGALLPYFVNFKQGGENKYIWLGQPSMQYGVYRRVLKAQQAYEAQNQ